MVFKLITIVWWGFFCSAPGFADAIEYEKLNHKVFIDALRAGNHDPSGANDYYFQISTHALKNTKADAEKPLEEREKISVPATKFGEVQVAVLTLWRPEAGKAEETLWIDLKGDDFRKLISEAMRTFKIREDEVSVVAEIEMFEKGKKFIFFGEDVLVGKTKYFPVPADKYQAPSRTNVKLSIVDDKGTNVILKVKYEDPRAEEKASVAAGASPTPGPN